MNILWFFLGIVVGFGICLLYKRSQRLLTNSNSGSSVETAQLQEQLHQTELALYTAVELSQMKGSFLARTSHELRSPMNGIIGMQQLILADLSDSPEEEREFIAQANASALKMVKVLDEIIDAAKVEQGSTALNLQPIPLINLLQEVHTLTHLQAQNRNLRLTIVPPDSECYVLADPQRLRQVLVSLIDAAVSQMEAGAISVAVDRPSDLNCQIQITTPVSASIWSDNSISRSHPLDDKPFNPSDRGAVLHLANQPFPHPGFVFEVARSLMVSMRGHLDIVVRENELPERVQIQCQVPRVYPDPSVD